MLEELNQKPESYRRKVVFFATCIVGIFIITVWVIITQEKMSQILEEVFPQNKKEFLSEEDASFENILNKALKENTEFPTEAQKQQKSEENETISSEDEKFSKENVKPNEINQGSVDEKINNFESGSNFQNEPKTNFEIEDDTEEDGTKKEIQNNKDDFFIF